MITLEPIDATSYKVVLQTQDLTEEEQAKLLRRRDHFPADFVHDLIDLIPPDQTFDQYDHFNMVLYVK